MSAATPVSISAIRTDGPPPTIVARRRRRRTMPYLLLIPAVGFLVLALGYPLIRQVVMSFQEYGLAQQFGQPAEWIGFDNFSLLLGDSYFWLVVARSIVFCLVNAALTMVVGIALALLMTRISAPIRLTLQIALLLAWAMPYLASLTVWQWLFDTEFGVVNYALTSWLGLDFENHAWLIEPLSFYFVATIVVCWMSVPFVAFAVYAALTQVPNDMLEAGEIDGANGWQRFRLITVPLIKPVLLIVGLLQIIWDLKVFTQIFVLQDAGGITRDTHLIGTYVYQLGIKEGDFGLAAAASGIILVLTVGVGFHYVRLLVRQEDEL
ncbi:MAG TPA: sugar ABC transporter permease [Jiangellaceae bacterium]|nr:sugar ABC transporter permease [Jiangellaceae bacterium]